MMYGITSISVENTMGRQPTPSISLPLPRSIASSLVSAQNDHTPPFPLGQGISGIGYRIFAPSDTHALSTRLRSGYGIEDYARFPIVEKVFYSASKLHWETQFKELNHPNIARMLGLDSTKPSLLLEDGGINIAYIQYRYEFSRLREFLCQDLKINLDEYSIKLEETSGIQVRRYIGPFRYSMETCEQVTLREAFEACIECAQHAARFVFSDGTIDLFKAADGTKLTSKIGEYFGFNFAETQRRDNIDDYLTKPIWQSRILKVPSYFTLGERLCILYQMARAISYLHERNIAHNDLTLHNTVINPCGRVRVIDFGLASYHATSSQKQRDINQLMIQLSAIHLDHQNTMDPETKIPLQDICNRKMQAQELCVELEAYKPFFPAWDTGEGLIVH